jgi:hypothetical protein
MIDLRGPISDYSNRDGSIENQRSLVLVTYLGPSEEQSLRSSNLSKESDHNARINYSVVIR